MRHKSSPATDTTQHQGPDRQPVGSSAHSDGPNPEPHEVARPADVQRSSKSAKTSGSHSAGDALHPEPHTPKKSKRGSR